MSFTRYCLVAASIIAGLWTQPVLAALTGEYKFEGTTNDTSGLGRNGTLTGGATYTAGLYLGSSQAIDMDGASTIQLPPATDFIRNAPGATLTAWVRPDDLSGTAARNIVVVNNGAAGLGAARALLEWNPANGFRAIGRQNDTSGSTIVNGGTAVVGTTYFLAGVFDYVNGDLILYINGAPVASNLNIAAWNANSSNTANQVARLGSHADGVQQFWNGAIDGVRIFNTALTSDQIMGLYTSPDVIPGTLIPGDTDGDGIVELSDLDPIRQNWMQNVSLRTSGDLVDDNIVNFLDFRQWKTAWLEENAGSGGLANVDLSFLTAVPEPATACLLLAGLLVVATGRQKRRS